MAKAIISNYISMESVVKLLCELRVDNIAVNGKRLTELISELPAVDEKEILRKTMERILARLEKLPYADDDGFVWLEDAKDVVKEEGGIE